MRSAEREPPLQRENPPGGGAGNLHGANPDIESRSCRAAGHRRRFFSHRRAGHPSPGFESRPVPRSNPLLLPIARRRGIPPPPGGVRCEYSDRSPPAADGRADAVRERQAKASDLCHEKPCPRRSTAEWREACLKTGELRKISARSRRSQPALPNGKTSAQAPRRRGAVPRRGPFARQVSSARSPPRAAVRISRL